ncbi:MAG TPA: protein kinase, partial [Thermoanaerobaculia bacterium]|nr:protein kinase [Thermoanaerobaculia bacterium]
MSGPGRTTGSGQSGGTGLETCPRCGAVYALPMEQCPGCGLVLPERAARMGPGTILDGKYQIVSLLGSGGMGEVFKVRHIQLNAVRTIKVLRSNLLADEWYRSRFLREARLATQVHHSNVAVVHDFATLPNGSYYMVSEFIDGLTVRQWLKRYGPFPLGLAIEVVSQVLSGLGHCHRRGLLHRDISPDNIMISVDAEDHPVAKIIDLGIAKQVAGNAADATQTGLFMGNPRYCSPEQLGQLKEGEELDLRTDLYSMGMVLYEMVTGSGPFQSTTPHGFFVKHLTENPPHLKEVKPDVSWPEGFDAALLKALEKDRNRRYKTAFEFADALKPFAVDLSRGLAATFGLEIDRPERDTDRTDRIATAGFSQVASASKKTDATLTYESRTEFEKKAAEEREWVRAQADGSEEAWRGFLDKYPDSSRRGEGLRSLSEAHAFKEAARGDSRDAWEGFLASWPQSRFGDEARRRAEQSKEKENAALERASSAGTADAYREFLKSYPGSPLAPQARAFLEEQIGFDAALQKDTEAAWEVFLKLWPSGRNASTAGERRQAAGRREEQDLAGATREGTSAALRRFLEKHPEGKSRPLAQERLQEAIDFEAAAKDGSEKSWRDFLDRHPKSARREEAGQMLAEARAFQEAARFDTREAWEAYLASWPESRRRDEAQKRVEQAKRKEAEALERAKAKASAEAYREFLSAYPRSPPASPSDASGESAPSRPFRRLPRTRSRSPRAGAPRRAGGPSRRGTSPENSQERASCLPGSPRRELPRLCGGPPRAVCRPPGRSDRRASGAGIRPRPRRYLSLLPPGTRAAPPG